MLIPLVLPGPTAGDFLCYLIVNCSLEQPPPSSSRRPWSWLMSQSLKHKDWLHLSGQLPYPISLSLEHLLIIQRPLSRSLHYPSSGLKASYLSYIVFSHSRHMHTVMQASMHTTILDPATNSLVSLQGSVIKSTYWHWKELRFLYKGLYSSLTPVQRDMESLQLASTSTTYMQANT